LDLESIPVYGPGINNTGIDRIIVDAGVAKAKSPAIMDCALMPADIISP